MAPDPFPEDEEQMGQDMITGDDFEVSNDFIY
jgi:hypothetical protein